ncbi:MAG: hypothetical protein HZC41_23310 [Chloroflexi bacterium]|nr:hypothetical protein [Chloroflexota bacterium]
MNRSQGVIVTETSNPEQERFIQAILQGTSELRQSRHEDAMVMPSVHDREAAARLRELRSRSNAQSLAFGYRE